MLSRKHYILLAEAIKNAKEQVISYEAGTEDTDNMLVGIDTVERFIIGMCSRDNPRFNLSKWERATKTV